MEDDQNIIKDILKEWNPGLQPVTPDQDKIAKLTAFTERLSKGEFKNIVILTGAGISTASKIPDYRSQGGLYERIRKTFGQQYPEVLTDPELILSRSFVRAHPEVESFRTSFEHSILNAEPTEAHYFCVYLHNKGWLRRVYTQNVDSLHTKAGVPEDKVVEVHGSVAKGNIVLYEDAIPDRFYQVVEQDFGGNVTPVDLVLVMGTSLQVAPFCALPNMVRKECVRTLVTQNPFRCFHNAFSQKRVVEGMYSSYENMASSYIKLAGRKVTLRSQWVKGKYKDQFILDMDVQQFAQFVKEFKGEINELLQ